MTFSAGSITGRSPRSFPLSVISPGNTGVAYTTVRHAMEILRDRGVIITRHSRGTFVTPSR